MKRRIFSVLFALVLVLSLGLVTAVPAAADPSPDYAAVTFAQDGGGIAEWSTTYAHAGSYSVKLYSPGTADYGKVVMPLDMEFEDLDDFSFYVEGGETAQALPLHDIKLEIDAETPVLSGGNNHLATSVDLSDKIVVLASQPGQCEDLSDTLMSNGTAGWEKYGTHSDATINVGGDTNAYWSMFVYAADGATWLGTYDYFTWDEIHTALDDYATVTEVRAELRYPQDSTCDCETFVASTVYVDDVTIGEVVYDLEPRVINIGTDEGFNTIQAAIDDADPGDTITVAAGAYTENVDVDEEVTLTGASSATVTVTALDAAVSVFTVTANNVAISGFTITGCTGPWTQDDMYAGIRFPTHVEGCNIHDNILTGNIVGILMIDTENTTTAGNNTFTSNIASSNIISGIEMQHTYGNTLTSNTANSGVYGFNLDSARNNTFTGNTANSNSKYGFFLAKGSGTTGSDNNTFTNNTANSNTRSGIRMTNLCGDSTYTGNTFNSNVIAGMELGGSSSDAISNLTGNSNSFSGNAIGIKVDDSAIITSVALHYSDIVGNTSYGASVGTSVTGTLDAKYNYWGDPSGPTITATNPRGAGDAISTLVDYEPWLHTTKATVYPSGTRYYAYNLCELKQGWNIWSTPIALDAQADTWGEYKLLGVDLDMATGQNALWFNASTPGWETVTDSYQLRPCDAIYIKVASDQEAPILFSPNVSAPAKTLYVGWNLVSASYIDDMNSPNMANGIVPEDALASVYTVPGPNNTGYSMVVSPAVNQGTAWTGYRGTTIDAEVGGSNTMLPCKGYWVFMTNGGTLAGTVFTPVSPLQ